MISHPTPSCACCGAPTPDDKRIDVRFGLPDAVFGGDQRARRHPAGLQALLEADGHGSFVRCLLPVRLTDGIELVIGTWLRISAADLAHAAEVWETPAYRDLVFEGTLANATRPWQDRLQGARVTATVLNEGEIPYVTAAESPAVTEILTEEWDRDHVLSRFRHALAVPVRTRVGEVWSIGRTPGLQVDFVDGNQRFFGPGRAVFLDARTRAQPVADLEALLAGLLEGAPSVPADQQLTERESGRLRHAFWTTTVSEGKEQRMLYGFDVLPGAALVTGCLFEEAADLAWAKHVWRSVRVEDEDEAAS